jgi:tetratricopeptide (TPR) repeat protein
MPHRANRSAAAILILSILLAGCADTSEDAEGASPPRAAVEAYEEGMDLLNRRLGRTDTEAAVAAFERAVEADPEYTAAWSGLARARAWLQWNLGVADQLPLAEAAAARADELDPDAVETHLALGYVDYWGHADLDGALRHFQAAERLAPDDAEVAGAIGNIHRRQGRLEEAIAAYERRIEIDPDHAQGLATLAGTYDAVGRHGDSWALADRLSELGDPRAPVRRFWASFHAGDTARAWQEIPQIQEAQGRAGEPGYFAFLQAYARDDRAAADALIEEIGTEGTGAQLGALMSIHLGLSGQSDEHAETFDGWITGIEEGLVENPATDRARLAQANRHGNLALLEALRGDRDAALAHVEHVRDLDPASLDAWAAGPRVNVALTLAVLDEKEDGLAALEELADQGAISTGWLAFEPSFDGLREDPRFEAIVAERAAIDQPVM